MVLAGRDANIAWYGDAVKWFGVYNYLGFRHPKLAMLDAEEHYGAFEDSEHERPTSSVVSGFGIGGWLRGEGPFKTLGDLDQCEVRVLVTAPLYEQLATIRLQANTYELGALNAADFYQYLPGPALEFPIPISTEEQRLQWVGIWPMSRLGKPYTPWKHWILDFHTQTYSGPQISDQAIS